MPEWKTAAGSQTTLLLVCAESSWLMALRGDSVIHCWLFVGTASASSPTLNQAQRHARPPLRLFSNADHAPIICSAKESRKVITDPLPSWSLAESISSIPVSLANGPS